MADKIRANYPAMEEMAKQCDLVKERLVELASSTMKIVEKMEGGVLLGQPGEVFAVALDILVLKTIKLAGVIEEQGKGIRAAVVDMQQADESAAGGFK